MTENVNGTMDVDVDNDDDLASDESIAGSDEMDSDDDDAQQNEWKDKKLQLQAKIAEDKTDYNAYVELIEVLKCLGELDELRKAREDFNAQYPLTPEMWLAWIEDEKNIATTAEEKEHVIQLFERALKDYLSVDIWLEYAQFSSGMMSIESVRSIMERALSISGLHASKGKLLWETYRELESFVLSSLKEKNDSEEDTDAIKTQKKRIAEIMRRQLSIPLMDMESTYQELRTWIDEEKSESLIDMEVLENGYKKALEKLSRILTFEETLLCTETEATAPIYLRYLQFEKNPAEGGNDPFRVRSLYERSITDNPLNATLWSDYIDYLSTNVKIPEDILTVCQRAVRNVPENSIFWRHYMVELERCKGEKTEITDILTKSLEHRYSSPEDYRLLWLSYMYYLLRHFDTIPEDDEKQRDTATEEIRTVFNMAFENLNQFFGTEGDPESDILLLWARFEAETTKDLERYRRIWTDIMNLGHQTSIMYWVKYINMEWQYGDAKHYRKLCERALTALVAAAKYPKNIVSLWLEFESMKGSLDSFLRCQKICEEKMKQYKEKVAEKKSTDKKKPPVKPLKKSNDDDKIFVKPAPKTADVKSKSSPVKNSDSTPSNEKTTWKLKEMPPPPSPAAGTSYMQHDSSKDDRTIFISNLDYTVTEDDVKNELAGIGNIEEFRLVRDFKGRSKGYGYMVFSSREQAKAALKKDRSPINQRPMFISECDPDKQTRKTGLRFNTGLEKNKLFVKGLPLKLDKEGVENIFKKYGTLKDVRLVTYRNGHSKGLAYVDFENEVSAAHALLQTDGMTLDDKTISVAISNPPERKSNLSLIPSRGSSITETSLGGGSGDKNDTGLRGRARTQLSFVPRTVQMNPSVTKMENGNGQSSSKPMSNDDFRKSLFGGK